MVAGAVLALAQCPGPVAGAVANGAHGSRRHDEKRNCRGAGHGPEQGRPLEAALAEVGIEGISRERPRGGNHGGKCSKAQVQLRSKVIHLTTQTEASDATHWSCRSMERAEGTTHSFLHRVWRSCGLRPHLVRTFKLSTDPRFEEKLQDVVGLYPNPPENAAVFSFDEESSIQSLDRTQPGLPLK